MRDEEGGGEFEVEAKLAVRALDPPAVLDRVAALGAVSAWRLVPRIPFRLTLEDRYLDTPDGVVGSGGFALRVRRIEPGRRTLLTLKGPGGGALENATEGAATEGTGVIEGAGGRGVSRRFELEVPAGAEGEARIFEALRLRAGVTGVDGLARLATIQARTTERRRFHLEDRRGRRQGEMVLDQVVLATVLGPVRFHEVEVEHGGERTDGETPEVVVAAVARALLHAFPSALIPWEPSKLATARRLKDLADALARGGAPAWPPELVSGAGDLLPGGLQAIESPP